MIYSCPPIYREMAQLRQNISLMSSFSLLLADESHLPFLYELYMHPDVNPYLMYEWMPEESFQPIGQSLIQQRLVHILCFEGTPVGMCKLVPLTYRSSHVLYLGGFAIDPSHGGKGWGLKLLETIIQYARDHQFLRIELSVSVENEKAIRVYQKAGFRQEGILQKYTHLVSQNRFVDEYLMAWLEEAPTPSL